MFLQNLRKDLEKETSSDRLIISRCTTIDPYQKYLTRDIAACLVLIFFWPLQCTQREMRLCHLRDTSPSAEFNLDIESVFGDVDAKVWFWATFPCYKSRLRFLKKSARNACASNCDLTRQPLPCFFRYCWGSCAVRQRRLIDGVRPIPALVSPTNLLAIRRHYQSLFPQLLVFASFVLSRTNKWRLHTHTHTPGLPLFCDSCDSDRCKMSGNSKFVILDFF